MDIRWWWCVAALAAAAVAAAAERGADGADGADGAPHVPSLDDDDDDDDQHLALHTEESRNVHPRAYQSAAYNALPSGFRPAAGAPSLAELAGYARPQQQQQQQQQQRARGPPSPAHAQQAARGDERDEESEEEREEPDRLAQLLQQSRFDCSGKQTGYYADQELQCEVFHYCQDSVKHSWICPDGFTFHQVHLICMPPTQDNICQQSAKYHFVNEYLYRPVNEEEVQRKPSLPLRYSERYYPAEVYREDRDDRDDGQEEEEEEERIGGAISRPSQRPAAHAAHAAPAAAAQAQVFRSAEEVNIPLLQRRPQRPYDFRF